MSRLADSFVLPFNEPEHLYAALDGVAGTMGSTYLVQLDQPVTVDRMRAVAREMVSAIPRFRGIIERGPWRSHLRILPDDDITDVLFEDAWRVEGHVDALDAAAVEAYHNRLINEGLPLERGLACRFRYIPHPQAPILFVVLHHLLFDGRSGVYVVSALLKRLNSEQPMSQERAESIPMLDAMRPTHWWQWPAAFMAELRIRKQENSLFKGKRVQMINRPEQPFMSIYGVRHYDAPCTPAQLRSVARKLGLNANAAILMALADAYLSYAPGDADAVAVIRQAVDLRPYQPKHRAASPMLGNQVGTFLVTVPQGLDMAARAASIKAQLRGGLERYDKRLMGTSLWLGSLFSYAGSHLLAYGATRMQRQLKMPRISCYATYVGNLTAEFNPPEATIKVRRFMGCGPSGSLLHGICEFADALSLPLVWQRAEATPADVDEYFRRLDAAFHRLMAEGAAAQGRRKNKAAPEGAA
jgi:hypothetical protein